VSPEEYFYIVNAISSVIINSNNITYYISLTKDVLSNQTFADNNFNAQTFTSI
jgi:hypothetical protein